MKPTQEQINRFLYNFSKLTKDEQESVITFIELLKEIEGLPVDQQQEIIDNITDQRILDFLKDEKGKLS